MRTATRLLLTTCLLALAPALPALAACPGDCSYPGGGSPKTDCITEFDGISPNIPASRPKILECTDGDPTCDADGIANGVCGVSLRFCLNNTDSRFPECVPSDVSEVLVKNKPANRSGYDPQLDALQTAIDGLGLPDNGAKCTSPQALTVPLRVAGNGSYRKTTKKVITRANTTGGRKDRDRFKIYCLPSASFPGPGRAAAKVIASAAERIEGTLSRGDLGDFLLYNDTIQVVVKGPGRLAYNAVGVYGGNIVDADLMRTDGSPERDNFETMAPGLNVENTVNYTNVVVLNDGSNGQPAVIRATGVDDLLDAINPSSVVAGFGLTFPAAADDKDLPIEIQTDYILEPGKSYVRIETTVTNLGAVLLPMYFGDYLNGSGEIEMFQPGYGFGEPLLTSCPAGVPAGFCRLIGYAGIEGGTGVSYGYVPANDNMTSFSTSGVAISILGQEALSVLLGAPPLYELQPSGSSGDSIVFTRYFIVGDGTIASLSDTRNALLGYSTGTLQGTVTSGGQPVAGVEVAITPVIAPPLGGLGSIPVATHARTDAAGSYRAALPPGSYTVRANRDGALAATPASAPVTVIASTVATQDFTVPATGGLRVVVTDENGDPSPAKVQLVGFDPSPDPRITSTILIINNVTGLYSEEFEDGLVHGIAWAGFAGADGDTGPREVEPGSYQLVVSRGPRYSAFTQNVTITAGSTQTVNAQIAKVIDTPGWISGDWHVHSIDSADAQVTRVDRVLTQLGEGMDFFTPSDHEMRVDFTPTINAMGVANLIGTAPSAEITTFDYGHFNSWPVTVDPGQVSGGTVDHGRAGLAPGQDFPSYGSYNLSPAEIIAEAHLDPKANLIQINHMRSFFNRDGLTVDTAEGGSGPPQSHTPGTARRLDPTIANYFDLDPGPGFTPLDFDVLEVWIGTDGRSGQVRDFVGENLGDWFNLLNQGILRAGVASSDTHQRRTTQINARTYVASSITDPALLPAAAEALAANVVVGRASGTNAPFVTVNAVTGLGSAGLGIGESTMVPTTDGNVTVTVAVKSPAWAPFDRIELYVNAPTQPFDDDAKPATPPRYRVPTQYVQNAGVDFTVTTVNDYPSIPGASHLEATATFSLSGIVQDSWIVAMVKGTDGVSRPLFPVLPNSLRTAGNTTLANLTDGNLGEDGITALAYTNPLYVDADNDALWTAPGVQLVP